MQAIITNIQHYCYHDGPGIRTNVFFKGCSLHCQWCSNPENLYPEIELAYDREKCVGCKTCLHNPALDGIVTERGDGSLNIDFHAARKRSLLGRMLCPNDALFLEGKWMTVDEVMQEVMLDASFYGAQGGITVSGGEPLLQPEFVKALFERAHESFMSTAIETAGNVPFENIALVLPHTDTMICDIKLMDPEQHKLWTGSSNERILENWKRCLNEYPKVRYLVRTPIIPGVNDDPEVINAILDFLEPFATNRHIAYEVLKYHKFGLNKYCNLGLTYRLTELTKDEEKQYEERYEALKVMAAERLPAEEEDEG